MALAVRVAREWPLIGALVAAVSLVNLPANIPTSANWQVKDDLVLTVARARLEAGNADGALELTERFTKKRSDSMILDRMWFLDAQARVARIRANPVPQEVRKAENSFRRAVEAEFPEPAVRAERLALIEFLGGQGLHVEAYIAADELMRDTADDPQMLLEGAIWAARAGVSGRSEKFRDASEAVRLLAEFERRTAGDPRLRALSEPVRARILSMQGRDAEALDGLNFALVEFNQGAHLPATYVQRARVLRRLARRSPAPAELLAEARRDLEEALARTKDPLLADEAKVLLGDTLRTLGLPVARDRLRELVEAETPSAPMARLSLARTRINGAIDFVGAQEGLAGIPSRFALEAYDLDVAELVAEIERDGLGSAEPERTLQAADLIHELRRLYPEREGLKAQESDLSLQAARQLAARARRLQERDDAAGAAADRRAAADQYLRSAELQKELSAAADLPRTDVEDHLRRQANRLFEGRLFQKAAQAYEALFKMRPDERLDHLMQAVSFREAGDVLRAHAILSEFIGRYSDVEFLKPDALLMDGEVLSEMGRYADAIARFRRVRELAAVGPDAPDLFWSDQLPRAQGIRLDLWGREAAARGSLTYWGRSLLGTADAAYQWARLERGLLAKDEKAERRRGEALEAGIGALEEFSERYLAGVPVPPGGALKVAYLEALLKIEQDRWPEATGLIGRALEIGQRPDYPMSGEEERMFRAAHTLFGDAALLAGDYPEAERRYDKAVRRNGGRPEVMFAWIGRVRAAMGLGQTTRAKSLLQEAGREYERIRSRPEPGTPGPDDPLVISRTRWERDLEQLRLELTP